MYVSPTKMKRFTLYHLQQNQIYIQDFYGTCTFYDLITREQKIQDKGKFYICSKSIVYESDNKNISLMKYRFESMKNLPTFNNQGLKFTISRITAIKVLGNSPPQPFKVFEDINEKIQICPSFENVKNLQEWITFLFENSRKKNNFQMQQKIYTIIIEKFSKKSFNMSLIDSVTQKPMLEENNILTRQVLPLNHIYGYLFVTDQKVYFEPFHNLSAKAVHKIQINQIGKLFKKRFQLRQIGLQIITHKSYYFTFQNQAYRNRVYSCISKLVSQKCIKIQSLERITFLWQTKQISNFQYLMHLNTAGNRSFSDLSQYPVFPWVLSQYTEQQIDLEDQKNYRDLSKPMGALNPDRLQSLLMRYQNMDNPKFMYGSHYSTPGYVIGYLVRTKPEYMLKLQSGKFDKPDRLFKSIKDDWRNVMQNPTSLKQLIPEFYQNDTSFLKNNLGLDLGVRQNKKRVDDVKLPKWAETPEKFLQIMRNALQSDYVSNNLHHWIDLIFGFKQRGQQAIKALNLFHPLTYQGMVDIEKIKDPIQKIGLKCQINQFGQCPKQIFKIPHPPKDSTKHIYSVDYLTSTTAKIDDDDDQSGDEQQIEQKFVSLPIKANTMKSVQVSNLYSNGIPKVKTVLSMGKQTDIKMTQISRGHKSQVVRALHLPSKPNSLLTIGQDGFLKIFDVYQKSCLKSFKICDFHLSCIAVLKPDQTFAIGSWDNNIYIFNIIYGSKSKPFSAHDNSINDIKYMPKRKRLISGSWDCSVKMFRYVGNVLDNQQLFYDHQNQVSALAFNNDENLISFGDIEGNIFCISIDQKQVIYTLNMNSQKITKLQYLQNNLITTAQTQIRLLDLQGTMLTSFIINKSNGIITDTCADGQHLFITTSQKQLILFDILQQKKIGNYFNDFTLFPDDKLPEQKQLLCVVIGNDGLFIGVGGSCGNIYILRS